MWTLIVLIACVIGIGNGALSGTERRLFKDLHNEKRRETSIKYRVSNMKEMKWNSILQTVAQEVADKCVFEHSKRGYGENLFKTSGTDRKSAIKGSLNSWQKEETDYDYTNGRCKTGEDGVKRMCGHYTQVNWAESYQLGCGMQSCPNPKRPGTKFLLVVCEYSPRGNMKRPDVGLKAYQTGSVICGNCPPNWQCMNFLCRKNYLTTSRTITDVILGLLKRFNNEEDLGDSDDNIKDNGLVERIDTDNLDRINIRGNEPIERNDYRADRRSYYRADGENNDSDLIKK